MKRTPLAFLLVLVAAGGAYALLGGQPGADDSVDFTAEELVPDADGLDDLEAAAGLDDSASAGVREESKDAPAAPITEAKRVQLALQGRVVDKAGSPVAGAEVTLGLRRSFQAFLGNREAIRAAFESLRDRGRERGRGAREQFRLRKLAKPVRTGADGRFAFRGPAFVQTSLMLKVTHDAFAPELVRREWKAASGDVSLEDIVVKTGGTLVGAVCDSAGVPVANAEVRWVQEARTPGGDRQRGSRGRGETARSGGGRFDLERLIGRGGGNARGRGGRRGGPSRGMGSLLEPVQTDARGLFELRNVPAGSCRLTIHEKTCLPATTERLEVIAERRLDCGRIKVERGATLLGVVRDAAGEPVKKARIVAKLSRTAMREQMRGAASGLRGTRGRGAQRNGSARRTAPGQGASRGAPTPGGQGATRRQGRNRGGRGQRGQRGQRGGNASPGSVDPERAKLQAQLRQLQMLAGHEVRTRTKDDGSFVLEGLPPAVRLEVRHEHFIDEDQEPVEPAKTPRIEVTLVKKLSIAGTVVGPDRKPVTEYGIVARRIGGPRREGARRGGDRGGRERWQGRSGRSAQRGERTRPTRQGQQNDPRRQQRDAERMQRESQRKAAATAAQAYRRERLGASGIAPRRLPEPKQNAEGRFVLGGLLPGEYVLDVAGPGFVGIAAGPFELKKGSQHADVTVRLDIGVMLEGIVVAQQGGEPVERARITLEVPPLMSSTGQSRFGRGQRAIRVESSRTDENGAFVLGTQRPGVFRVRLSAAGFVSKEERFTLSSATSPLRVEMVKGARLFGEVTDREEGARYTVYLTGVDGERKTVRVDREKGSYEFKNLAPGGYAVRVESGGRGGLGRFGGRGGSRRGGRGRGSDPVAASKEKLPPDVFVTPGTEQRYDVESGRSSLAKVTGIVFKNGAPAKGFEVRLTVVREASTERGGRGGRSFGGNSSRGSVGSDGSFKIEKVTPGRYTLEVRANGGRSNGGRRGARSGSAGYVHRETVALEGGKTLSRNITVTVGELRFKVLDQVTGKPIAGARVALVPGAGTEKLEGRAMRRTPGLRWLRVGNGEAVLPDVTPGPYRYMLSAPGVEAVQGVVTASAGSESVILRVAYDPAKAEASAKAREEERAKRRAGNDPSVPTPPRSGGTGPKQQTGSKTQGQNKSRRRR